MAKFVPAFDIWQVPDYLRPHIQPGQWVYAGDRSHLGRFYGASMRTCVVAWQGNAKGRGKAYQRALSDYGRNVRYEPGR